jgi:NAD(P)-dependent dehydrogenase (short-subunit alcohol dehydrogenase family)
MTIAPGLHNRVALVTGASRGVGAAIALALAEAGAAVEVNYRERAEDAEAVAAKIRSQSGRALAVGADVSQGEPVAAMIARVAAELGPADVLVNNAGVGLVRGVDDLTEDDFDLTIAVNLKSAFLCTQAVLPAMRARRWGCIVNISSGAARRRRYRRPLQRLESRDGGADPRLCRAPRQGGHHRQRGRPVADRDRHDAGPPRRDRAAHSLAGCGKRSS